MMSSILIIALVLGLVVMGFFIAGGIILILSVCKLFLIKKKANDKFTRT